jgi:hypothetical protein
MFNNVSQSLISYSDHLLSNPTISSFVNQKVGEVRTYWDPIVTPVAATLKTYVQPKNIEITDEVFDGFTEAPRGFDSTPEILARLTGKKIIIIHFTEIGKPDIRVQLFYDRSFNADKLNSNINKIVTRIYNLGVLFQNKKTDIWGMFERTIFEHDYQVYLYSNPRRANPRRQGQEYLQQLNQTMHKCFNTSSGETDGTGFEGGTFVVTSRLEETLGLLTHEALHGVFLTAPGVTGSIGRANSIMGQDNFNIGEMFVNSIASIIHAYMISHELGQELNQCLRYEIIHSFNQASRLGKISGHSLQNVLNTGGINFYQNAYMFEYINGRAVILANYNYLMLAKPDISAQIHDMAAGTMDGTAMSNISDLFSKDNSELIAVMNLIDPQLDALIEASSVAPVDTDDCGNMIMQYFCLDPMEIDDDKIVTGLYGGSYKQKYLKYKNKYLELKNIMNKH